MLNGVAGRDLSKTGCGIGIYSEVEIGSQTVIASKAPETMPSSLRIKFHRAVSAVRHYRRKHRIEDASTTFTASASETQLILKRLMISREGNLSIIGLRLETLNVSMQLTRVQTQQDTELDLPDDL
jgi:hypothetical protein